MKKHEEERDLHVAALYEAIVTDLVHAELAATDAEVTKRQEAAKEWAKHYEDRTIGCPDEETAHEVLERARVNCAEIIEGTVDVHSDGAVVFSGVISIEFEGGGIDPIEAAMKTKALIQKAIKARRRNP